MKFLLFISAMLCFAQKAAHATCSIPKPTGLHATAVTSCSITMEWNTSPDAAYYIFWYEKNGSTTAIIVNVGTSTSYYAAGLLSKKPYNFKVEAFCADGTTKGYSTLVKDTTLQCSVITSLEVSSVTSSSAIVSWQSASQCSASSFKVRYRIASSQAAWVLLENISATSQTLTALMPDKQYEVQAARICNGNTSAWSPSVFFRTMKSRPNILFILEDDGRYDTFPSTGGPSFFQTPAINRIANEGINFKYMIPATSECTPSRCSIYTGLYPHKHGATINNEAMIPGLPTIQQILHDNGYYTGFVGKYGVKGYVLNNGTPLGFDWSASSKSEYINPTFNVNGHNITQTDSSHFTQVIQDYALSFLDSIPQGKPFLLFYFTIAPHGPTVPRMEEADLYENDTMPFPSNFHKYTKNYPSYLYTPGTLWLNDSIETDSMRRIEFQTTKGLDYSVDTLFQFLEAKGILDNTLIIFSSDNGFLKGEHLLKGKEIDYEESIRLPLFIRYPKWFAGGTLIDDEIASNIDIAATLLEAAGIPDTFHTDGVSLHQLAIHVVHRKDFLYEFPIGDGLPAIRAVRGLQYKYTKSYCNSGTEEFFNLLTDPHEDTNLINKASYSALIQTYRNKLDSLRTAFSDVTLAISNCYLKNPTSRQDDDNVPVVPQSLTLFPNPTDHSFTISISASDENELAEAEVYNLFGRMIVKKSWEGNELKIDCSGWPAGSYIVEVKCGQQIYFSKLTVLGN
ncbi:MAG TPA: sulfatase-like hydrolase/transferase [Chitinophagales bacterium]|nr:sulfatase-like hydrolase/transferase [Chitinophagales bacterium]